MTEGGRGEEGGKKVAVINLEGKKPKFAVSWGKLGRKNKRRDPCHFSFLPFRPRKKDFLAGVDPTRRRLSYKKKLFSSLRIARWKKIE